MFGWGRNELGVFWRDVALIAALMLTYSAPARAAVTATSRTRYTPPIKPHARHKPLSKEELRAMFQADLDRTGS
jgi:hypothetical protein